MYEAVTDNLEDFINEKIQIRAGNETWNFGLQTFSYISFDKRPVVNSYNSTVKNPFSSYRNIYGGTCFSFSIPEFLWRKGTQRVRIYLKKAAFIRYT